MRKFHKQKQNVLYIAAKGEDIQDGGGQSGR